MKRNKLDLSDVSWLMQSLSKKTLSELHLFSRQRLSANHTTVLFKLVVHNNQLEFYTPALQKPIKSSDLFTKIYFPPPGAAPITGKVDGATGMVDGATGVVGVATGIIGCP